MAQQVIENMGIGWINRDHDIGLKLGQKSGETILQGDENAIIRGKFFLSIEPVIDCAPDSGSAADHSHVEDSGPVISQSIGFREKIMQLDVGSLGRDPANAIAEAAGGAVMSFAKPGGQDQDLFQ